MHARPSFSGADLHACGRDVPGRFLLTLDAGGHLAVEQVLRLLPGRRLVGIAEQDGRTVLCKIFFHPRRHAADLAHELAGIERLTQAGIATQERLADATHPSTSTSAGCPVLRMRHFANAQTLGDTAATWHAQAACPPRLAEAFALLGQLHRAGFRHDDLHLNNLLITAPDSALRLLDGDAVAPLNDEAGRLANLALFCAQLFPAQWRAWREALVQAYAAGSGLPAIAPARLEQAVTAARTRRLRHYLKKCLRECSEFSVRKQRDRFCVVRRDARAALGDVLDDPDQLFTQAKILKGGTTCTVARVEIDGCPQVLKRYNIKGLAHLLSRAWRPSRGWHSWRNGHHLAFLGIATPTPLALVEERWGPLRRRAWLISAWQDGQRLDQLIAGSAGAPLPAPVMAALAEVLRELRAARLVHGDLKATNLVWDGTRMALLDLDAMAVRGRSYPAGWRKDRRRLAANWPEGSAGRQAIEAMLDTVEREIP